jgi:hypothetical protein
MHMYDYYISLYQHDMTAGLNFYYREATILFYLCAKCSQRL